MQDLPRKSLEANDLHWSCADPDKSPCPYGDKCYRKNPRHFEEYSHPSSVDLTALQPTSSTKKRRISLSTSDTLNTYGFYLFRVHGLRYDYNPTITLKDILDVKHGYLVSSAQFNFMFDVDWLLSQYPRQFRSLPLLLVHGFRGPPKTALDEAASKYTNIRLCMANIRLPYGVHHTKMMFLKYTDGLKIVIHTANMISDDWNLRTQGVWVSPKLSPIADNVQVNTDSETGFRADLIDYLRGYGSENAHDPSSPLGYWINEFSLHDFRPIRVFLVGSVSGRHTGSQLKKFGHPRLGELLSASTFNTPSSWPVVGQFSSIGSLGAQPTRWLTTEWSCSLAGRGARGLRMIYPCVDDVRNSLEGYDAGGCLPYTQRTAAKQPWLRQFLHRWQAGKHTRAAPHIKSYTRISPDGTYASWFLLTSANLSKSAWGAYEKDHTQLMIRSYELGVLFLPEKFQNGANCFTVTTPSDRPKTAMNSSSSGSSDKIKPTNAAIPFPVPYDLPPVPYNSDDEPWLIDVPHEKPDVFGRIGEPE
ncbi:hypothetical protein P879_02787 [Paragonimus westermani]|uniref:PBZ-type domain-containing protein n=1 Tax=Paragonimus westermani TaxID=34504 RepID=A0A8T0DKS2_9TREM|nr:hypothetical protein P879_02787 [Paragonimus westermani]